MNIHQFSEKFNNSDLVKLVYSSYFFKGKVGGIFVSENHLLGSIYVNRLILPTRFIKALSEFDTILTLKDLLNTDYNEFLKFKNCGLKTIHDVKRSVILYLNKNTTPDHNQATNHLEIETPQQVYDCKQQEVETLSLFVEEKPGLINFVNSVDDLFSRFKSRDLEIALQRWGRQTLTPYDEIGKNHNITRERVRQILSRIIKNLTFRNKNYLPTWRRLFLDRIVEQPVPIGDEILINYNLKYSASIYLGLISEIFAEVPFNGYLPKSFEQTHNRKLLTDPTWNRITLFLDKIEISIGTITPKLLISKLSENSFDPSNQLLCFKIILASKKYFFYRENNDYFLLRRGGLRDITYDILVGSENPMSVDEILFSIRTYYDNSSRYESINSVMGNIKQDNRIIQFDRYKFGLQKHFAYPENKWHMVCSIAKRFLFDINRQCYVTEILERVVKDFPGIKTKYELVNILRTDEEIIDLGFFTFIKSGTGVHSRIKLRDVILNLYKDDSRARHYLEIRDEISKIRHVRSEGLNVLLKSIDEIIKYPCSFYGLRELEWDNKNTLSTNEQFIKNYVSNVIYPNTKISNLLDFFKDSEIKTNCLTTIERVPELKIVNCYDNIDRFVVSINWSLVKIIKCILFHHHKPMYLTELKWLLDDLNISDKYFQLNKHKIYDDEQILKKDNMFEYFDYDVGNDRNNTIIDMFYELLLETKTTFSLKDFFTEFRDDIESEGLDEYKLRAILKEDERFIITNEFIMVRS